MVWRHYVIMLCYNIDSIHNGNYNDNYINIIIKMNKKSLAGSVLLLKQDSLDQSVAWNKLFFVINVVKNLKRATRLHGILMFIRSDNGQILKDNMCYNWDLTIGNTDVEKLLNGEMDVNKTVNGIFHKSIDKILNDLNDEGRVEFDAAVLDKFAGRTMEFSTPKGDELFARITNIPMIKFDDKGQYVLTLKIRTTQGGVLFKKYSVIDTKVTVPLTNLCR